ncbi:hypothetical protein [Lentzea sp. NPDC060358]|uniref:hypothetical protein n=1 Tax=Lentzea sp. NPDC060358 TaxID=3347103 RepID=UPI0036482F84
MPTKRLSFDEYGTSADEDDLEDGTEPTYGSYYVVLPENGWQSEVDPPPKDDAPQPEPTRGRSTGDAAGIVTALVAGAVPAVVVDQVPVALAVGLAAGVAGGLLGRSAGIALSRRRKETDREA